MKPFLKPRLAIPKSYVLYLSRDIMSEQRLRSLPWAACGKPEARPDGHIVPSSIKTLGTLGKSDNKVCCEPQLPATFDRYAGNSAFGINPFFFQSNQFSNVHTLHTELISGMALWDLFQIWMVQWSGLDKDQHMMQ